MNKDVKEMINAFGAMAEICKIAYDSFINTGFTESQAMYLASVELQFLQDVEED